MKHPKDIAHLQEALALAQHAVGLSDPNPRVGCVIVGAGGQVIGRGHTQQAGGPHAEVMALRDAQARGHTVRGATVVVTLEPCAHHGRTPPCCDALIEAGVGRVVMALQDPNPLVAGQGAARLRAAGVTVDTLDDEPSERPIEGSPASFQRSTHGPFADRPTTQALADAARELNIGFFSRMQRGRPWVRLKAAVSLDGRTALNNGASQWITGSEARADGHAFRKRAGAVLTGVGTVQDDDPRLDVRLVDTARQPLRVVVDSRLAMLPTARVLAPPGAVLVYAAAASEPLAGSHAEPPAPGPAAAPTAAATSPFEARRAALQATGAEIALLPGPSGKVDLPAMLADLARRGVNELHVEAGHKLNGSFVREGLVDEFLIYMAPRLFGVGRELAAFGPLERLQDALALRFVSVTQVGDDLRIIARPFDGAPQPGSPPR